MAKTLPLAGLKIVVTRPREQAAHLAHAIEELGGVCIPFPLLEITPLADKQPLHDLATRLHQFQMAIFISPNAVRYAMEVLQNADGLPDSLQIATVGQSSRKLLQDSGVSDVIAPHAKFDSESLLSLPELQHVNGMHIVIFRGDKGRELLGDTLRQRGATVEYTTCYRRRTPQLDITPLLAAIPDALSVSSSEALHNLCKIMKPAERALLENTPLFVSHDRIAAAAHKLGWQNIISAEGGDEGLMTALTKWAAQKKVHTNE